MEKCECCAKKIVRFAQLARNGKSCQGMRNEEVELIYASDFLYALRDKPVAALNARRSVELSP